MAEFRRSRSRTPHWPLRQPNPNCPCVRCRWDGSVSRTALRRAGVGAIREIHSVATSDLHRRAHADQGTRVHQERGSASREPRGHEFASACETKHRRWRWLRRRIKDSTPWGRTKIWTVKSAVRHSLPGTHDKPLEHLVMNTISQTDAWRWSPMPCDSTTSGPCPHVVGDRAAVDVQVLGHRFLQSIVKHYSLKLKD